MRQSISLITLGVDDLERSKHFPVRGFSLSHSSQISQQSALALAPAPAPSHAPGLRRHPSAAGWVSQTTCRIAPVSRSSSASEMMKGGVR
jgi:hypothetical protein